MRKMLREKSYVLFLTILGLVTSLGSFGQTVLIDPTQGGGFELGSTFAANGWSESNSANNPWVVGTAVSNAPISGNSAYISNNGGVSNAYTTTTNALNYFWRDVTVPAGESVIKLTFNWQQQGESTWDLLQVFTAPTSITPTGTTTYPGNGFTNVPAGITGATYVGNGSIIAGVQTSTLFLPASLAGTTFRLIFSWKNDGGGGTQPPAAIDNISLTSRVPGNFISIATGNWVTPTTWDANDTPSPLDNATVSVGDVVTIATTGQGINNLVVNGTLQYGATPTQFDVNGNLTVNGTGIFNVYNATTGKTLVVKGNIINNGNIDISVGTGTAGNLTMNGNTVQSVTGTGTFGASNVIRNITFGNTNLATPNIIWSINNVKVANNLNLTGARIDLGSNKMTFGNNAAGGTLTVPAGTGFLPGAKFVRWWTATATGSAITAGAVPTTTTSRYPFINVQGQNRSMWITRTNTTGAVAGEMGVRYVGATTSTSGLSVVDGAYTVTDRFDGNWTVSDEGTAVFANTYSLAIAAETAYTSINGNNRIMYAGAALTGTHQNGTTLPLGQRITVPHADLLAGPLYLGIASADLTPPTPGALTQSVAPPTCTGGTDITAAGSPGTDVIWYWQTSATGTSTTTPYAGAYTVFSNGTYYLRAFNTVNTQWSVNSSSIVISNFPTASPPPVPTPGVNPACAPGTTLTAAAAPVNETYYWQTVLNGTSTASNASTPLNITTTGTYYLSSFDASTSCWSTTSSILVTVDTYIPAAPTVAQNVFNICSGTLSQPISATTPPNSGTNTVSFGTNLISTGTGASTFNVSVPAIPAGASITSAQLQLFNVNAINGSWRSEIRVALSGAYTLAATQISTLGSGGLITPDPIINLAGFPTSGGSVNLLLTETFDDPGNDATFGEARLVITWSAPASTIAWYDASTGGTNIGSGSPFESIGTSVLASPATNGNYSFYAGSASGGCSSATRTLVTVAVSDVNAVLTPVNVSCNGGNNGSFTLGTVNCGSTPFVYSVNGGAFGAIPTNLLPGTYSVVIRDAAMLLSSAIPVVITQPGAPSPIVMNSVNYFTANISWTPSGDETSWNVEYGPFGFTPGTGTVIPVTGGVPSATLTGLNPNTQYTVYVTVTCGPGTTTPATANFTTNAGFFTYDNDCGPGFFDIAATGTNMGLTDDGEGNITMPFSFNYQGTTISTIRVGNNGGIMLGVTTGDVGVTNGTVASVVGNQLLPFWDDLGTTGSGVTYQVVGTAPNRQLIVQWNRNHFGFSTGTPFVFQVVIDEATSEIWYLYNNVVTGSATYNYGASATIGAAGNTDIQLSQNNATYLQNNSCIHFYSALCPNPTGLVITPYQEEVILDWNAGAYAETSWTVIYGPTGFDPATGGTTITVSSSDANILGLDQNTTYDVYIYSECQADNLTSSGLMGTFTTLPWCSRPTGVTTATAVDSLFTTWNWVQTDPSYPSTGFNLQYGPTGFALYSGTTVNADNNFTDTTFNAGFLAGGVYQVYVQSVCGVDTSNYVGPFTFVMPLTNDDVCGAEGLAADGTVYTFNNAGATVQVGEPAIAPSATGASTTTGWANSTLNNTTWFTFVAPASGQVRVNNTAINYNGQAAVYNVTDCSNFGTFTFVAGNDDAIGGGSSAPNFTICGLTPGNTYYLMHDGFSATTGNYSISISPIVLNAGTLTSVIDACANATVDLTTGITGQQTGGVWTSALASTAPGLTGSMFNTSGYSYQTFRFEYRVSDGCAFDTTNAFVKIWAPSSAGNDGNITVCRNQPVDLLSGLSGNVDLGGTWYNPSNVAIASSQITSSNIAGMFNYSYITGNGVCPNDTSIVLVTVNGSCNYLDIEEMYFGEMTMLPNPTNGKLYITNTGSTEVFNYTVTDIDGRVIETKSNAINGTATTEIDLTGKVTGMYMIKVYNDSAEKVFRVILQ